MATANCCELLLSVCNSIFVFPQLKLVTTCWWWANRVAMTFISIPLNNHFLLSSIFPHTHTHIIQIERPNSKNGPNNFYRKLKSTIAYRWRKNGCPKCLFIRICNEMSTQNSVFMNFNIITVSHIYNVTYSNAPQLIIKIGYFRGEICNADYSTGRYV